MIPVGGADAARRRWCYQTVTAQSGRVTCLALMSYPQNPDDLKRGIKTIKCKIPGCSPRDNEFVNVIVDSSSNERMGFENADCTSDALKRLRRSLGRGLQQKLDNAFQVGECLVGVDYLRQRTGFGREVLRPAIFASK